jgi:2OG-Fe(II) oxygenase superfamily
MDWFRNPTLKLIVTNRRWQRRHTPFPHFVAENVFPKPIYKDLEEAFRQRLRSGIGELASPFQFGKSRSGYDAFMVTFDPKTNGPFQVFLSRAWHDMLADILNITATADVSGGLHYHLAGSPNGKVHNDLNPGWFANVADENGTNVACGDKCDYKTGATHHGRVKPRETVRAAAMLFYLNNHKWCPGDGGETALYGRFTDQPEASAATIPPINNSLLLFECTPTSWHTFLANQRYPRSSVILWLHREKKEVVVRWGEHTIVKWQSTR